MEGFEVTEADLGDFTEREAERRFRELLWAEAARTGIVQSRIHAPSAIHVPDGGFDAKVEDVGPSSENIIPAGISGFQTKSSDVDDCEDEVTTGDGELHGRIANLLDDDGTYLLAIFEQLAYANEDMGQNKLEERKEELEVVFADFGYSDAAVRVYDSNKLVGFFNQFPGLVANIKGINHAVDYTTWAREITHDIGSYVSDAAHDDYCDTVRELLRTNADDCPVVRVTGPSGVGKTRFVYEALSHEDLRSQVLFAQADRFKHSDLADLLRVEENWHAIIVLEDCGPKDHEEFAERFRPYDRLTLITISDNPTQVTADEQIELQSLDVADVADILEEEFPDASEIDRIARFSEGFPGIAALLIKNVSWEDGGNGNLLQVDEAPLERLIGGREYDSDELRKHKRVLEVVSLFERVGWRREDDALHEESEWLANVAGFSGQDGLSQFTDIVTEQKERGILRGDYYLSVTPLPLATHLMQSWLDKHGTAEINDIFQSLPAGPITEMGQGDIRPRFGARIPYMASSPVGQSWISAKLGPDGLYYADDGAAFETEWGSQLFLRLAEASPTEAIRPLEEFIEGHSVEELLEFTTGRRNVVRALERMTVWEETFGRAARILLALGEAENEHWANNASGVFAGLFSPAPGKVAPTEVSPMDRLPLIQEALQADSPRRQELGVNAADSALTTDHFFRDVGREYQGARPMPDLWHPDSRDDFVEYYHEVWTLVTDHLDELDDDVRGDAVDVLVGNVRGLAKIEVDLSNQIRDSLEQLVDEGVIDERKAIRAVVNLIEYESDALEGFDDQLEQWKSLLTSLSDETYEGRLKRYVGLSLLEDNDVYESQLEGLAEESVSKPDRLTSHIPWLVTSDPNLSRVYTFGYKIGARDTSNQFLEDIVREFRKAGEERSVKFLSGYLSALKERDEAARRDVLDRVQNDDDLRPDLVDLARLSGITTHDAERIIDEIEEGRISATALRGLEGGSASRNIDEPVFQDLCSVVMDEGEVAVDVLPPIFFHYYVYPDDPPGLLRDLTLELLTHPAFVEARDDPPMRQGSGHQWKETAEAFLTQYPDDSDHIVELILETFGEHQAVIGSSRDVKDLLHQLLEKDSANTWAAISSVLAERDERLYVLSRWLRGDDTHDDRTPILDVPVSSLWSWVEEDVENNASIAALLVPAEFFHGDTEMCLAREVLARYGDREQVQEALSGNYGTEFYTGLGSKHHSEKKERLEAFKEAETDPQVIRWVEDEIQQLEKKIDSAAQFEERIGIDE